MSAGVGDLPAPTCVKRAEVGAYGSSVRLLGPVRNPPYFLCPTNFGGGEQSVGHFGHFGHQIGKLLYKPAIENFPKPLSYPSKVSKPPLPLDNRATAQPLPPRRT